MLPKDKKKSEKMYNHIKDYLLNFPLPQAFREEDISCTKFEEIFKNDPLSLFREYAPITMSVSAFVRYDYVGSTIKVRGKDRAHGYGLYIF